MVKNGITNVLCLQPFGCIANQVVAKGVSKRMKETYPELNLLFLDLDAGVSEVNFFNRLFFFVERARQAAGFKGDNLDGNDSNRSPEWEGEDLVLEKL